MAAQTFHCTPFHPLTRQQLAPPVVIDELSWTEVVAGNGVLTGKIALPRSLVKRDQLRYALEPDSSAIYVKSSEGAYVFGGVVVGQEWDPENGTIAITAVEWRGWLYSVFLGPKLDLTADLLYGWTQKDQLQIAREIVAFATAGGTVDGRPQITLGAELSGKLRDLNIRGLDFKYAGELIDTIAKRSGGFEWTIKAYDDSTDFLPRLQFVTGFPELGGLVGGMLLRRTPNGGNFTLTSPISRSTTAMRTRVWTTGSTETLPFAVDSDPALPGANVMLREKMTAHSTVTERTTLASHARAERLFWGVKTNILSIAVLESTFGITTYPAGSRCRLAYQDQFQNIDLAAVRIIERKVTPRSGAGLVEMQLDMSDFVLPEVDTGGVV